MPRVSLHLLTANKSQLARNVRLLSGDREPWQGDVKMADTYKLDVIRSLYLFDKAGAPLCLSGHFKMP